MEDSKVKFSVDGLTDLHQAFQSILTDSKSLTEVWAEQGNLITASLKEQLELLKQRNQYAYPPQSNPATGGTTGIDSGTPPNPNNRLDLFLRNAIYDGVRISKISLKELAAILGAKPTDIPATGGAAEPGQPSAGSQTTRETDSKTEQFLKGFVLTNLLRPIGAADPFRAGLDMGSNVGMSLIAQGGKAGWIGAALSAVTAVLGAKYNAVSEIAPTAAEAARVLGGNWAQLVIPEAGQTQYGLRRNDILQRQMQLARAMGRQNLGTNLDQALLWEQTTSLSASDIAAFAQSARGSENFNIGTSLASYFETLRVAGVSQEKIQTQMSEYLRELVTLNQSQLQQFGRSNEELNSAIYSAFASLFPKSAENNPAFIGRMAQNFYSGMTTASSDQISALQYSIASRVMGGRGSWYGVRMMREDPFALTEGLSDEEVARRRQYATELLKGYRQAAGGTDQFALLLEKQFGFTANQAYRMAQSYDAGTFSFHEFEGQLRESKMESQLRENLPKTVDSISKMLAEWEATKIGTKVDGIQKATEGIFQLLQEEKNGFFTKEGMRKTDENFDKVISGEIDAKSAEGILALIKEGFLTAMRSWSAGGILPMF